MYYRVINGEEDAELRIQWSKKEEDCVDPKLTGQLLADIKAGMTVVDVKTKIAEHLKVDSNQVILSAWGGIRPGRLEGHSWEVRQIQKWLCRCLSVEIWPQKSYLLIRGHGREYTYHSNIPGEPHAVARYVKSWIRDRLVKSVHQAGQSKADLGTRRIQLKLEDAIVEGYTSIPWGSAIDFTLPPDAAELFSDEENWLLSATETCFVCWETKRPTEFPCQITSTCKHEPQSCKACLRQWIASSLNDTAWDRLKCSECQEMLKHSEVRRFAASDVFAR